MPEYFAQADSVQIGQLIRSYEHGSDRVLEFSNLHRYKPLSRHPYDKDVFRTGLTSASCGVASEPGATYILFSHSSENDSGLARVDSCTGSRLLFSGNGQQGSDFIDVPLRFLPQQLLAQAGLDILQSIRWPLTNDPANTIFIGLLDLKTIAHGGKAYLYVDPNKSSDVVGIVRDWADVQFRESGYEVPAALVFAEVNGWYRLRMTNGRFAWLNTEDAGTYFPYAELVKNRLNYLVGNWNGLVWPQPGAGLPALVPTAGSSNEHDIFRRESPVRIVDSQSIAGSLWLRVEILDTDECQAKEPKIVSGGWIPAYDAEGQPTAWYYSRGC